MTEGHSRRAQRPSPRTASLVLPPVLTTVAFAGFLAGLHLTGVLGFAWDPARLQDWVRGTGALAPLAFVGLLAIRPLTFVPSMWLAPVAWGLFGWVEGSALKVAGETAGAMLAFLVARHGFRRASGRLLRRVAPRLGRSMDAGLVHRLGRVLEKRSTRTVLALRCNLLLPFDALNYGLGLTPLRPIAYLAGTCAGIIPGTVLYVGLAGSALAGDWIPAALTAAGIVVMVWLSVPLARDLVAGPATGAGVSGAAPDRRGRESPARADRTS